MKRTIPLFIFTILFLATVVHAEVSDVHQTTTTPGNARFEILQSELAAKWTFRLDRFTGEVYQLVKTAKGNNAWQKMIIEQPPETSNPTKPRFVLFTSGIAAKHTFLMDTTTGKSWVVIAREIPTKEGETIKLNIWSPFEEQ